ncbi:MAG: ATP-binding protein [Terracidiphilus sp.]|jgi:signal transduction histidine kinase
MQQTGQAVESRENGLAKIGLAATGLIGAGTDRFGLKRVETVVKTLPNLHGDGGHGENLVVVAHDARNLVTALWLYCDLLEEPGVLNPNFDHYAGDLRLVAAASRRLVEKLLAIDANFEAGLGANLEARFDSRPRPQMGHSKAINTALTRSEPLALDRARQWELTPGSLIDNLAGELVANRNLLSALAGPAIVLDLSTEDGAQAVRMSGEDLTRILVNLVKNAAEAMPGAGRITITLHEFHAETVAPLWLKLTVEDNGLGIPFDRLEKIFDSGHTTKLNGALRNGGWPASHRGLGLSITRSIVEAAGGHIHAADAAEGGARFQIELPVRSR